MARTARKKPELENEGLDVAQVERVTLHDRVYEEMRRAVVRGKLAPGRAYPIRTLGQAFGTSVMPIRGAIHQLLAEGALEALPNRSVRVPPMTSSRYRELCDIRVSLECLAIGRAAEAATPARSRQLATINDRYRRALAHGEKQRIFDANQEFHFALYEGAQAPILMRLIENAWLLTGPFINLTFKNVEASATGIENHDRLLDAFAKGDVPACKCALEDDIRSAEHFIIQALKAQNIAAAAE
jgi:DNA-binding GntR family transcriptional regulator